MDPGLAKGFARKFGRDVAAAGGGVRESWIEALDAPFARNRENRRQNPAEFNHAARAFVAATLNKPGVLHANAFPMPAPPAKGGGSYHMRRLVQGFAQGQYGALPFWHVLASSVRATRRRITARSWICPTIVSQHAVERYYQRAAADPVKLAEALDGAIVAALIWGIDTAPKFDFFNAPGSIAVPVPGGVFVGGMEGRPLAGRCPYTEATTTKFGVVEKPQTPMSAMKAASLNTFIADGMLRADQKAAIAPIRDWNERHRDAVLAQPEFFYGMAWDFVQPTEADCAAVEDLIQIFARANLSRHFKARPPVCVPRRPANGAGEETPIQE